MSLTTVPANCPEVFKGAGSFDRMMDHYYNKMLQSDFHHLAFIGQAFDADVGTFKRIHTALLYCTCIV